MWTGYCRKDVQQYGSTVKKRKEVHKSAVTAVQHVETWLDHIPVISKRKLEQQRFQLTSKRQLNIDIDVVGLTMFQSWRYVKARCKAERQPSYSTASHRENH